MELKQHNILVLSLSNVSCRHGCGCVDVITDWLELVSQRDNVGRLNPSMKLLQQSKLVLGPLKITLLQITARTSGVT